MRDDLSFALATVDWADTHFPSFQQRMQSWVDSNIYTKVMELEHNPTHNMVIAAERDPFPWNFSIEFGAYINVLRSALDILAYTIAGRHSVQGMDKVYFPIARNAALFSSGNYKGIEFIKQLPDRERALFESLKPYKGGNDNLWRLHHLDIERKHRRLLIVEPKIAAFFTIGEWNVIPINGEVGANGETALCFVRKESKNPNIHPAAVVAIDEPTFGIREQAGLALQRLSKTVRETILIFDV